MKEPVSIMGRLYDINDVVQSLKDAGCTVILTEYCDRYDIQEAMESLNFTQSETFWDSLLPKSIGEDKPLAVIRV